MTEKWKEIPKQLLADGVIKAVPSFSDTSWEDFLQLISFRDGLVHASACRPDVSKPDPASIQAVPVPKYRELSDMTPGWPLSVVVTLIKRLNSAAGTPNPEYFAHLSPDFFK